MKENKLIDLSMDFAVEALDAVQNIKGHYALVNQIERSATSIGANIHEANYAHSKPDFISKMQIALKETYETEYWLKLFIKSEIKDGHNYKHNKYYCTQSHCMPHSLGNEAILVKLVSE